MRSIQIVAPDHSGMAMDVDVIRSALRGSGCEVSWGQPPALSRTQKLVRKTRLLDRRRHRFRLNVLIQAPFKWSLPDAEVNCLIPNQEWFSVEDVPQLRHVQEVWCKSEAAVEVFRDLGCTTRYIGFSSHDLYDPELGERRDRFDRCLHVNGSSAWKGTQVLLDTWLMHPEWPHLTVVTRVPVRRPSSLPTNLTLVERYLPASELRALVNRCGISVQPTEMEGYGHSLAGAMSAKAVVLVTDGAPMNERIDESCGVMIAPSRQEPHYMGRRYFVSPASIERAMAAVLGMGREQLERVGAAARRAFVDEERLVACRILAAVADVL